MLTKIKREDAIANYPNLPLRKYNSKTEEDDFFYPGVFANYVLTLSSKSYKGHIKLLGAEIAGLASGFDADKLIFLGDVDIPWLFRDHDYKPAKEGLQYLTANKIGKRFNGAIQVGIHEIPEFIKHLAWLVRTNAVLPYVHFIDPKQNIIGDICQHGNLHISTINQKADGHFKELINKSQFIFGTNADCFNKFSKRRGIKGRQIVV